MKLSMTYPDKCIKGIPNKDCLYAEGYQVATHLFEFKPHGSLAGAWEQSINWYDDESAVEFTLNQKKQGSNELQFKAGAAVVLRSEIDRLKTFVVVNGRLSYDRQPLQYNPYHGNILIDVGVNKKVMLQIAAALALCVAKIEPPKP